MKSSVYAFAVLFSLAPLAAGCAEEPEPVYPSNAEPVGYTEPKEAAAAGDYNAMPQNAGSGPYGSADNGQAPEPSPASASAFRFVAGQEEGQGAQGDVAVGEPQDEEYADTDPSALTDFHSTLDPYGTWVDDSNYGTVWVPSETVVGDGFSPYVTAGHWTYGDDYVWMSDYSWGWAPFHYGRWTYIGGTGWGWIPGRTYAGAWVSWRTGYDDWGYVGWAPMPPTWYWRGGYAYGLGSVPYAPYSFCASGDLFQPALGGRLIGGAQVGVVASHTRPFVGATPAVGGHIGAHPSVAGPSPGFLRIPGSAVARAPMGNAGITQAREFARPSTAVALGARAPQGSLGHVASNGVRPGYSNGGRFGSASTMGSGGQPSYRPAQPSYRPFAGGSPSYRPSYQPYTASRATPSYYGGSRSYAPYGGGGGGYHPSYGPTYGGGAPTARPSRPSRGRSRSSGTTSSGYTGGSYRGGYHGGGGGFRGGGGGFRGGGGGGGRHR